MEEEAKLACQAELLLAKVVLDQTANRLQEIEHLEVGVGERVGNWEGRRVGGEGRWGSVSRWIQSGTPVKQWSSQRRQRYVGGHTVDEAKVP